MTAHELALSLGAAAFDFGLTPSERDALDRHLASCAQCRSELDGMADDARRIVSRPVHRMSPARSAAVRATLERPRRAMSPAMVLVAAALLLLLAIAVAAVGAEIVRRLDESRLAIEPVPSGMASPGPADVSPTPRSWSLTAIGSIPGLPFEPSAIADTETGWIAVSGRECVATGESTYTCTQRIARSADGRTWSASAVVPIATGYIPPTSGPEAGIVAIAAGPDGFVAVGFARDGGANPRMAIPDGAAWWSADGVAWERVLLDEGARPSAVFRAPDRWLIGGVVYGSLSGSSIDHANGPVGAIWSSTDGRRWTLLEGATTFDVGGYVDTMEDPASGGIRAFASNGATILAGGDICADTGRPCVPAAWTSTDGATWERVGALPAGDWLEGIVGSEGCFVAAVRRCPEGAAECSTILVRSTDGRTWEAVPGELPSSAVMTASDGTVVVVSGEYRTLDVRTSADGAAWSQLGSVSAPERVNWGRPLLLSRPDGGVDLQIRFDPLTEPDTTADVWTALWEIVPAR